MQENKLIRVLKTFDSKELKRFMLFVDSPYFNKNQNFVGLLNFIKKHHPVFHPDRFNEKEAFIAVFPDSTFKEDAINKLLSKLFKLLGDFFAVEKTMSSSFKREFYLLCQYDQRNLSHDFHRLSKNIRKNLESKQPISINNYHNILLFEQEVNRVASTKEDKGVGDANFGQVNSSLDLYYMYFKLIYTCQEINRQNIIKGLSTKLYNKEIIGIIPKTPYIKNPIISIWYEAYLMLSSKESFPHYSKLKQDLFDHHTLMDGALVRNLFTFLENTAISNMSGQELYEELFSLYNFQIDIDVLLHKQVTAQGILINYINVAHYLGKIDTAAAFMNKMKPSLMKTLPENFLLCEAIVLFHKEKYKDALGKLNEVNPSNINTKLFERIWRLKVYYQLKYRDILYDSFKSFRVFLTNNKDIVSDSSAEVYKNYITCLSHISKSPVLDSETSNKIFKNFIEGKDIVERKWLLQILNL